MRDTCDCGFGSALGISSDPYERAMERISALIERGQDPILGTMRRLAATTDAAKIAGIVEAAQTMIKRSRSRTRKEAWLDVMCAATRHLVQVLKD